MLLQSLLPKIGFTAFSSGTGAMIVDIFAFLDLRHQCATALSAPNETMERETINIALEGSGTTLIE